MCSLPFFRGAPILLPGVSVDGLAVAHESIVVMRVLPLRTAGEAFRFPIDHVDRVTRHPFSSAGSGYAKRPANTAADSILSVTVPA